MVSKHHHLVTNTQTLTTVLAWEAGAAPDPVGEGPQNGKLGQDAASIPGGSTWGKAETLDRTRRQRLSAASMVIL